jgi:hypothetical protein
MTTSSLWHIEHREKLLQEIGRVTVRWAALDMVLLKVVWLALDNRAAAYEIIFGSHNAGKQRLEAFNRVIGASKFTQEEREALLGLSADFARLLGTRNDIVHSPLVLALNVGADKKLSFTLKSVDRDGRQKDVSEKKIHRHSKLVGQKLSELEDVVDDLFINHHQPEPDAVEFEHVGPF